MFRRLYAFAVAALFPVNIALAQPPPLAVVAGASGETGIEVVKALKTKNIDVRGLTRDVERAKKQHGDIAEWIAADAREPSTLAAAFAGATYAISTVGSREAEGANDFQNVDWLGNRNLIDAAKAAEVKTFILTTSGSTGPGDINDPQVKKFGAGRVWKAQAEDYLRASGMPYVIIAPGGLRNYAGNTKGVLLRPRNQYKVGIVSRADVAAVIVECLTNKACNSKTMTIINTDAAKPGAWVNTLSALPIDSPQSVRLAPQPTNK